MLITLMGAEQIVGTMVAKAVSGSLAYPQGMGMAAQPRPWLPSEAEGGPARRVGGMEASASLEEEEEEGVPPEPSMRRTRSRLDTRTKCANCQSIAAAQR